MSIHAPLIELTKADIIRRGMALGVDYALTISCYQPDADGTRLRPLRQLPPSSCGIQEAGSPIRRPTDEGPVGLRYHSRP